MSTEQSSRPHLTLYRGLDDRGNYVWFPFVTKLELLTIFGVLDHSSYRAP